jgi:hypothetical protein
VATKCWTAALRVSIDAASRPCIPAAAFLNSESCRCSIMEGPTSTAAQGDPSSLRATTTMPPSTSTVRIIGSFRFASAPCFCFELVNLFQHVWWSLRPCCCAAAVL